MPHQVKGLSEKNKTKLKCKQQEISSFKGEKNSQDDDETEFKVNIKKKTHIRTGGKRSKRKYLRNYMIYVTIWKTVYQKYFTR